MATLSKIFRFPNPVNEVSARLVAGGVVLMALLTLALQQPLIIVPLAYGFVARVLAGPTFSPLGQLVTRLITPRLPVAPKLVSGPPKRFAQFLGAAMTLTALVLVFGFNSTTLAFVLIGVLAVFATLESVFALCVGCKIFAVLMRLNIIPQSVCAECNNIWERPNLRAYARQTVVQEQV